MNLGTKPTGTLSKTPSVAGGTTTAISEKQPSLSDQTGARREQDQRATDPIPSPPEAAIRAAYPDSTIRRLEYNRGSDSESGAVLFHLKTQSGRELVAKYMPLTFENYDGRVKKFFLEESLMEALEHRGLYKLDKHFFTQDYKLIVYEYIKGDSLRERLKEGPLSVAEVLPIIREVLETLTFLQTPASHPALQKVVIHRDLKPSNIIINAATKLPVIIDFSSAFITQDLASTTPGPHEESPTRTFVVAGSPYYVAPEVGMFAPGKGSDPYSLGVIALELLNGTIPTGLQNNRKIFEPYQIPKTLRVITGSDAQSSDIPPILRDFLQILIRPNPNLRYQSAEDALAKFSLVEKSLAASNTAASSTSIKPNLEPSGISTPNATILLGELPAVQSETEVADATGPSYSLDSEFLPRNSLVAKTILHLLEIFQDRSEAQNGIYSIDSFKDLSQSATNEQLNPKRILELLQPYRPALGSSTPVMPERITFRWLAESFPGLRADGIDALLRRELLEYDSLLADYPLAIDPVKQREYEHGLQTVKMLQALQRQSESSADPADTPELIQYSVEERQLASSLLGAVMRHHLIYHLTFMRNRIEKVAKEEASKSDSKIITFNTARVTASKALEAVSNGRFRFGVVDRNYYHTFIYLCICDDQGRNVGFCLTKRLTSEFQQTLSWTTFAELQDFIKAFLKIECGVVLNEPSVIPERIDSSNSNDFWRVIDATKIPTNGEKLLDQEPKPSETAGAWFDALREAQELLDTQVERLKIWHSTTFKYTDLLSGESSLISLYDFCNQTLHGSEEVRKQILSNPNSMLIDQNGLITISFRSGDSVPQTIHWGRLVRLNGKRQILPAHDAELASKENEEPGRDTQKKSWSLSRFFSFFWSTSPSNELGLRALSRAIFKAHWRPQEGLKEGGLDFSSPHDEIYLSNDGVLKAVSRKGKVYILQPGLTTLCKAGDLIVPVWIGKIADTRAS